jgi:hypothetical protein
MVKIPTYRLEILGKKVKCKELMINIWKRSKLCIMGKIIG